MSISQMKDEILIAGTGALACLMASRLSAAGISVTMLGTWKQGPDGLALTLQNGLGNYETLIKNLGLPRAQLGVTTIGATLVGPGHVYPGGDGIISLGIHPRLEPIKNMLRKAGITIETVHETERLLWSKLIIKAAINPLTALLKIPNGELLERPSAKALMASAAIEAANVARALGQKLIFADPVAGVNDVARRTAANHSSMYQDLKRGAPTEIDTISGAIVRVGEEYGVPTPVNQTLWQLVRASVKQRHSMAE
jgi:2-dehydropantoate 2-reductase